MTSGQLQILAPLIENPDEEYHLSELGKIIGKKPGVFQKGINALEREGWVLSRRRGNQRLVRINGTHPLLNEIRALVRKTVGVEALLKKALTGIEGIWTALIFGSYAKNRMRRDSDIDLLVVAGKPAAEDELVKVLGGIEKQIGREINYKFYIRRAYEFKKRSGDPFLKEVLSDSHVLLKGEL